jgi:hypothetical protein
MAKRCTTCDLWRKQYAILQKECKRHEEAVRELSFELEKERAKKDD